MDAGRFRIEPWVSRRGLRATGARGGERPRRKRGLDFRRR
jgi:hypothetical protein